MTIDYFTNNLFELVTFYHVYGPISLFINCFCLFVVKFKTPKSMGDYGTHLSIHLFSGLLLELSTSVLCCPILHPPFLIGSTHGILTNWFHVDVFYQQAWVFILLQTLMSSVSHLILYRCQCVLLPTSPWKLSSRHLNILIAGVYLVIGIPSGSIHVFIRYEQDGMDNAAKFVKDHPEYPSLAQDQPLYKVDTDLLSGRLQVYVIVYLTASLFFTVLPLYLVMLLYIQRQTNLIEQKQSYKIMRTLALQVAPILVCYTIPGIWFSVALYFKFFVPYNQVYNDVGCALLFCMPSSVCAVVTIYVITPYREYVKGILTALNPRYWTSRDGTRRETTVISVKPPD